jgi:hypothetical protein
MEREVCSPQPTTLDTYLPQSNICNIPQELSSRFPSNQEKSTKSTRSTSSTKFDINLIPILEGFGAKSERGRNSLPRRLALLRFLPSLPPAERPGKRSSQRKGETKFAKFYITFSKKTNVGTRSGFEPQLYLTSVV